MYRPISKVLNFMTQLSSKSPVTIQAQSVSAGVARMIKFYNMPLLTAGGLTQDYSANKTDPMSEFHMLTRTGLSYSDTSKLFVEFWKR